MILAEVVERQVVSEKHEALEGATLLWVVELGRDGRSHGEPFLAVDAVGAGTSERVLVTTEGGASTMAVGRPRSPVDAAIVGIVDDLQVDGASGERAPARAGR